MENSGLFVVVSEEAASSDLDLKWNHIWLNSDPQSLVNLVLGIINGHINDKIDTVYSHAALGSPLCDIFYHKEHADAGYSSVVAL